MTDEELIARLRKADEYEPLGHDGWEAADRIEALVKERDRYLRHLTAGAESLRRFEARAERLEAALSQIADTDPDEGTAWFHSVANAALSATTEKPHDRAALTQKEQPDGE